MMAAVGLAVIAGLAFGALVYSGLITLGAPAVSAPVTPTGSVLAGGTAPLALPTRTEPVPLTPIPRPTPTPTGGGGTLVFDWLRERNRDIYALDLQADGGPVRLTSHPGVDRSPAWSPDGRYVAFTSRRDENWDLYLLDPATGATSRLTDHPHYDGAPSWSPDGQQLAFESMREGDLDVFILRLEDGSVTPVTLSPAADYAPVWSPDGTHIAFVSWRDGNQEVYVADPAGTAGPSNFSDNPANDSLPRWRSATELSFVSDRGGKPALYVQRMGLAGTIGVPSSVTLVGATDGAGAAHGWSPDGEQVAYVSPASDAHSVLIRVPDRRGPAVLYLGKGGVGGLDWFRGLVQLSAQPEPEPVAPLYVEELSRESAPYELKYLPGIRAPNARLSDRVDDSFNALRQRVLDETGHDFLSVLSDAWRPIAADDEGASFQSWHKAGRAIDTRTELRDSLGRNILIIAREEEGAFRRRTYWRLYLRTSRQDGTMGEPLKQAPWDFFARFQDAEAAEEGGRQLGVPAGYYVDFTALAAEYGWERIAANERAGFSWKDEWIASDYWHFEKREDTRWRAAMLEVYDAATIDEVFGSSRRRWDRSTPIRQR